MASASLSTPKNAALRDDILALLSDQQPRTAKQLFEASTIAAGAGDVMSILKPMIEAGDIQRAAPVAPGEPGGMPPGKGAKPVASYRLAASMGPPDRVLVPRGAEPLPPTVKQDDLIAQLHRLEHAPSALSLVDARRLRALAETGLFFAHVPDWSLYLIGLAERIEDTL